MRNRGETGEKEERGKMKLERRRELGRRQRGMMRQ